MKKITIKYITSTISSKELLELKEMLKEKENQELFKDYVKDYYDVHAVLNKPDVDKAFDKLWKEIEKQKPSRQLFFPMWFKYAAAAVLVLMFSLSYYLINNKEQAEVKHSVVETGTPGFNKAILTLEDGSNIVLEKGQPYNAAKVTSNGEQIIYDKKDENHILYNYLTVPRGGRFEVELADGTRVWLNSDSKLKYPVSFKSGTTREVELVYGEAYFDVSSSKNHNGASFKVRSKLQEVEVLGTEFNLKAYKDDISVYTTLVEGEVSVKNEAFKEVLDPGYQSVVVGEREVIDVRTVNVYNEIAWKEGIFSFRDKPLKEIMKSLSRWYDVDILIKNKELEDIRFNGVLSKTMTLEEILIPIKRNTNLKYKLYDKKIIIE
ncbi:DUF4974 domain-containing protein [Formosa sediminum]|uniref:DUF4974 domain-containing protein n=1 Tax=Formosa sediminum TaxID=2594004 RepID=A0A516GVE0_9FLAO|nr:FecR domain-containing protein [Formosa sediminum]QDO95491.1 DUF4974 domain-containing protein [Formosa sediminum]